jgi:integrase
VSGRTKTIALARLRELAHRVDAGDTPTHDKITVRQAVTDYLDRGLSPRLASNTRYLTTLYANRLADTCGALTLRSLTTRHVEDVLADLAAEGKSERTLTIVKSTAGKVLDHAIRQGWLPAGRNVARLAVAPAGRSPDPRPLHTDADLKALLAAAGDDRWAPLLATVIVTGCRVGEAIAQPWTGIDRAHHAVHITSGARHEADGAGITARDPKARSTRRIKIPPALSRQLVVHRTFVLEESLAAGRAAPDLAFPTSAGTMANWRNLDRWLDKIAANAGIPVKGWHDFRHTLATALGDDGTPLTQTAAVLGHRNIDTTGRVYTHPHGRRRRRHQTRRTSTRASHPTAGMKRAFADRLGMPTAVSGAANVTGGDQEEHASLLFGRHVQDSRILAEIGTESGAFSGRISGTIYGTGMAGGYNGRCGRR